MSIKQDLVAIFQAGLKAVDPEVAIKRHVRKEGSLLILGSHSVDLKEIERVYVIGAGKGTAPMAVALEDILGERISDGAVTVKYGHGLPLRRIRLFEAGHPVPDEAGVRATEELLRIARKAGDKDLIIAAFSGGGSALTPAPVAPVGLEEKQEVTRLLLACGATIGEINAIRKHLSRIKGGGLARAAYPARIFSLILSDVVGDLLDVIASGPTAPDPTTFEDCLRIIDKYGIRPDVPEKVLKVLEEGVAGVRPETPKKGDPVFNNVVNLIVGNNFMALDAAQQEATKRGYRTLIMTSRMEGEAREVAKVISAIAKECAATGRPVSPPACFLFGGETTVTIKGDGLGGRNQELALACAVELDGWNNIWVLSAGTDGTDGPTDVAGAFADGQTVSKARNAGIDALDYLRRNDSFNFFKATGDHLHIGPTRTNVMDMVCVIVAASGS
ncbi:glycerate kinase type-2 family protein [Thermodesulforhabdus norvegica]|nr:glycerate kinase [Thermodesulforhabdus norvegica]